MTAAADPRFWNENAEMYAAKPVDNPEAFDRKTEVTKALIEPDHTVLDIGCGTGSFVLRLASTGAQVHGLDLSTEMIRIARGKARDAGAPNVHFHAGAFDASFTAFEPGTLDGVFAYSLLHLVPDRTDALQRMYALLRPGGYLVASTVCLGESWVPYSLVLGVMRWMGKAPWVCTGLTKAGLHAEMEAAGFVEVRGVEVGASATTDFVVARKG
jgi:2-polyprenyl-3-methyl-5-hydroxy-6-metoxy-1,4-benzoquinol methylase